jgi:hypothetical protein
MKAYTTLLIFLFFSVQSFAQKGVYLKPYAELRASTTYYYESSPYNNTPYFKFETQKIILPKNTSALDVGLLIGYTFNNTISIESGIAQSGNASGYKLSYNLLGSDSSTFYSGQVLYSGGTAGIKIPLLVTLPLLKYDSVRLYNLKPFAWSMRLKLGFNFYKQPKGNVFIDLGGIAKDSIITATHTRMDIEGLLFTHNNKTILYQLGLETEFNFKRVKGVGLNFYYLYGRKSLSGTIVTITIDQQIGYLFRTLARGSGFCLQLSKKIAMKPKKQKQQKDVDYYKN